jgi:hypothetical protein
MKKNAFIPTMLLLLLLLGCTTKKNNFKTLIKPHTISLVSSKTQTSFYKLEKLSVWGDFDGDKKVDTIYEHNFSNKEKKEINFAPNPMKTDWDEVVKWFYNQDADVTLTLNRKNSKILHLGIAQGLYCLLNIGDNNKDGKDEIAFVIDKLDDSRTNTCKIYTWCNGKWQLLKEFGIREDAFDWEGEKQPKFNSIKGYLEKQNGTWNYLDYNQTEYDSAEEVGKLKVLRLNKCK